MYFKVEPTGCSERKGLVQIRFSFYLDTDNPANDDRSLTTIESERAAYLSVLDKKKAYLQSERDLLKAQLKKLRSVTITER